jgi:hypothetical protein
MIKFSMEQEMEEYYKSMGYSIPPKYSSRWMELYEGFILIASREAKVCGV